MELKLLESSGRIKPSLWGGGGGDIDTGKDRHGSEKGWDCPKDPEGQDIDSYRDREIER